MQPLANCNAVSDLILLKFELEVYQAVKVYYEEKNRMIRVKLMPF